MGSSPITRSNKEPPKGAFLLGQKGKGTRRERPALRQAKIPPVEEFLVPRAGGGTAPVPPVSPITRSNKGPPKGAFLLEQKGEWARRERPAPRQAKIPPVEGFLVPRAGGGTAPVPPVSPITRSRKNKPSPDGLFFLRAPLPLPPAPSR